MIHHLYVLSAAKYDPQDLHRILTLDDIFKPAERIHMCTPSQEVASTVVRWLNSLKKSPLFHYVFAKDRKTLLSFKGLGSESCIVREECDIGGHLLHGFYELMPAFEKEQCSSREFLRQKAHLRPIDYFSKDEIERRWETGEQMHSEKYLNNTRGQFLDDIDRAFDLCGLNKRKIDSLYRSYLNSSGEEHLKAREKMDRAIYPVFKTLRIAGYSYYDLIG